MSDRDPKNVVRRLIDEVMNHGNLSVLEDLYSPRLAPAARRWVEPFLASFTDVRMRIVELVAEGETVVGRFACSGTHAGTWLGHPATGRRGGGFLPCRRRAHRPGLGHGRHGGPVASTRPAPHIRRSGTMRG